MLALKHDVFLQLGVFYLIVLYQDVFTDNFDSIQLLVHLKLSQEHLSEGTFAKNDYHFEVCQSRLTRSASFVYICVDKYWLSYAVFEFSQA